MVPPRQCQLGSSQRARISDRETPRLGFELVAFLLIVATFAAVLFKDVIVDRHFTINSDTITRYTRYWFSDGDASGTSSVGGHSGSPMRWQCRLTPIFANPYCGFGIMLDAGNRGVGRDLRRYDTIALDLDYVGPARTLKIVIKDYDPHFSIRGRGDTTKPNVIDFPVQQGPNRIRLNLGDAAVEQWWIALHPGLLDAGKPALDNIVAIDLQTGTGAPPGRYSIALHEIGVGGQSITPEHWYLMLLGGWTGLTALYLVYRVACLRHDHASRQQALLAERQTLLDAHEAAQTASRAKTRFLTHISHELRAPLNAILGYAQILRAGELSHNQNVATRTIQHSGEHLLTLTQDILDLSKIEAGKLDLVPRPVALRNLVRGVADMVTVRAKEKGLAFEWKVAAAVPLAVFVDDKCLRQVLLNLLGNAIKFTAHGEVRLDVALMALTEHDTTVRIEVRDTGVGIHAEDLHRIFEPFEQAQDEANHPGGTGLGLSISRRIIEMMHGELSVDSIPNMGSCFSIELSLAVADSDEMFSCATSDRPETALGTVFPTAHSLH